MRKNAKKCAFYFYLTNSEYKLSEYNDKIAQ